MPGATQMYEAFGGPKLIDLTPTKNQKIGYYSGIAISLLIPGGAEAKVEQYSLRAIESGFYPVMTRGFKKATELVWLEKGEIWKIGTTKNFNPFTRYTKEYLENVREHGLQRFQEFVGTRLEALELEKMKIMNYLKVHGVLPAGNKIIK